MAPMMATLRRVRLRAPTGPPGPGVPRLRAVTASPHREDHTRVVFVSLVLAGMAFALSQTVVSPALPELQRAVPRDAASAAWILTGYLLAASIATPIVGKLGDVYGRGRVLTSVLLVFAAGSVDLRARQRRSGCSSWAASSRASAAASSRSRSGSSATTSRDDRVATAIGGISATFGVGGGLGLVLAGIDRRTRWARRGCSGSGCSRCRPRSPSTATSRARRSRLRRADRLAGRGAAVGRARRAAVRAEQGERVGLGLRARARAVGRAASLLAVVWVWLEMRDRCTRWSRSACSAAGRC